MSVSLSVSPSQCSKSCSDGVQTRDVRCLTPDKQPSFACNSAHKPHPEQTCNSAPCSPSLGVCYVQKCVVLIMRGLCFLHIFSFTLFISVYTSLLCFSIFPSFLVLISLSRPLSFALSLLSFLFLIFFPSFSHSSSQSPSVSLSLVNPFFLSISFYLSPHPPTHSVLTLSSSQTRAVRTDAPTVSWWSRLGSAFTPTTSRPAAPPALRAPREPNATDPAQGQRSATGQPTLQPVASRTDIGLNQGSESRL